MTEWPSDADRSDVDDFISAVRHEPTEAQLKALGLYSTRRTGQRVEQRLSRDPHSSPPLQRPQEITDASGRKWRRIPARKGMSAWVRTPKERSWWRRALRWFWNPNVIAFAGAGVLLWLALSAYGATR